LRGEGVLSLGGGLRGSEGGKKYRMNCRYRGKKKCDLGGGKECIP